MDNPFINFNSENVNSYINAGETDDRLQSIENSKNWRLVDPLWRSFTFDPIQVFFLTNFTVFSSNTFNWNENEKKQMFINVEHHFFLKNVCNVQKNKTNVISLIVKYSKLHCNRLPSFITKRIEHYRLKMRFFWGQKE
jgi:hypothetical protein